MASQCWEEAHGRGLLSDSLRFQTGPPDRDRCHSLFLEGKCLRMTGPPIVLFNHPTTPWHCGTGVSMGQNHWAPDSSPHIWVRLHCVSLGETLGLTLKKRQICVWPALTGGVWTHTCRVSDTQIQDRIGNHSAGGCGDFCVYCLWPWCLDGPSFGCVLAAQQPSFLPVLWAWTVLIQTIFYLAESSSGMLALCIWRPCCSVHMCLCLYVFFLFLLSIHMLSLCLTMCSISDSVCQNLNL